jgi:hypothetical protein
MPTGHNALASHLQGAGPLLAICRFRTGPDLRSRWRRGGDSNSRKACAFAGFQDRCIQPLCHLSVPINSMTCVHSIRPRRPFRGVLDHARAVLHGAKLSHRSLDVGSGTRTTLTGMSLVAGITRSANAIFATSQGSDATSNGRQAGPAIFQMANAREGTRALPRARFGILSRLVAPYERFMDRQAIF